MGAFTGGGSVCVCVQAPTLKIIRVDMGTWPTLEILAVV